MSTSGPTAAPPRPIRGAAAALLRGAVVAGAFAALFGWLFRPLIATGAYLSESDLFDWFLPLFLSPPAVWSSDIFAGLPVFADTSDAAHYPLYFFFARVAHSWSGYVILPYVLGATFAYAYGRVVTGSRLAAAATGLAYGLSEAMIGRQAHINFVHAFAWFPLMVLAVDRLVDGASSRWIAVGAAATACCFLSGHPQPVLYAVSFCVLYGVTGAIAGRRVKEASVRLVMMFALAGLVMAIKAVPFAQATLYIARQQVGLDQFVSHANSPAQMMSLLFPAIAHDRREASLYVGLVTIILALLGARQWRGQWRVALWVAAALVTGLVAMGKTTPVAAIFYLLPVYRRSRVITRMLFIFAFAVAVLAGWGIAALQRKRTTRRDITTVSVIAAGALLAGAVWTAIDPARFVFEFDASRLSALPWWNTGIWVQVGIGACVIALLCYSRYTRAAVPAVTITLLALLAADELHGQGYGITARGLQLVTVPAAATRPSVHARQMAADLLPLRQRYLAIGGTTIDPIVPGGFARLWHIPIAGGYSPIVLERLTALATMGGNGDVRPETLGISDAALDLLAVRYITVRDADFPPPATFERGGTTWAVPELDIPVGRSDCGFTRARSTSIQLPAAQSVSTIDLVMDLRCAEDVPQGTVVGAVDVAAPGVNLHHELVAGVNISDRGLSDESIRQRARHQRVAAKFDDPALRPDVFRVTLRLPAVQHGVTLSVHGGAIKGWLVSIT